MKYYMQILTLTLNEQCMLMINKRCKKLIIKFMITNALANTYELKLCWNIFKNKTI